MKWFSSSWQQVFFSMDLALLYRAQAILQEHSIPFKTKIQNRSARLTANNLNGRSAMLSRMQIGPGTGDTYQIFVHEKNAEAAEFILRSAQTQKGG